MNLSLSARWREVFGIDLRTLALFRVALAAVIAVDLCWRLTDATVFYTDWGVMPRDWLARVNGPWRLSLHMANGEPWFAALLLWVQILLALALLIGYRTRLSALLTFLLLGSLHNRNPMILIGGDNLMMCLLFWSLFLPIGARFSVDVALSTREPSRDNRHVSWASAGLLIQVMSVYLFSAALKNGADWWPDGTAVYYALNLDRYATPLGVWLLQFPDLLKALSYYVYFLEWIGPLIVFLPWAARPIRLGTMLLLMAMHIGFILCLELGPFPYVSLASLTAFLGGWFWDWAAAQRAHGRTTRIYYDRDCGFCYKSVLLLRTFLVLPQAEIRPAQDSARADALMQAHYSWVVIDAEDRAHLKWAAFVALLRDSLLFGGLYRLAALPIWTRPGNAAYDFVGRHRGRFGTLSGWLLPQRELRFESGRLAQGCAGLMLFVVFAWNLGTIKLLPEAGQYALAPLLRLLRIDQEWNMFAPYPWRDDGWYVMPGRLSDGREVDVLRPGEPLSYDKPRYVSQTHETPIRWRTYRQRLWQKQFAEHRLHYARYLCRNWNVGTPENERVLSLKMIYMLERSLPDYRKPAIEQRVLWRHDCVAAKTETPDADGAAPG